MRIFQGLTCFSIKKKSLERSEAKNKEKVTGESQGLVHGWLCQVHGVRYELNADVGEVLVGLCPARHGNVRLEWNPECPCLLHNYGHGGSCDFFMGLCY